jgi:hypothetical protein
MFKKILPIALSVLFTVIIPAYAQDPGTATQAQVEKIYAGLAPSPPSSLTPNTIEHKATRWAQYKEEGGTLAYSAWSNVYNSNMTKAKKAQEVEIAYMNSLGWGAAQKSVKVGNSTRRLDIADVALKKAVEVKSYETGVVYATIDIKNEVSMDTQLVKDGWKIEWVFKACKPSAPLKTLLDSGKITIKEVP